MFVEMSECILSSEKNYVFGSENVHTQQAPDVKYKGTGMQECICNVCHRRLKNMAANHD